MAKQMPVRKAIAIAALQSAVWLVSMVPWLIINTVVFGALFALFQWDLREPSALRFVLLWIAFAVRIVSQLYLLALAEYFLTHQRWRWRPGGKAFFGGAVAVLVLTVVTRTIVPTLSPSLIMLGPDFRPALKAISSIPAIAMIHWGRFKWMQ